MTDSIFPQPQNVLDSTVARIADAVESMVPNNVCVNISTSLLPTNWSSESPYIQIWTNNKVTDECAVKVEFPAEASNTNITYLEFEKVAGGVKFTAPTKPNVAIPVIVHIINAEAESITDISADMVSTNSIPNASNVEEGLSSLNSNITTQLDHRISNGNVANINTFTDNWLVTAKQGHYRSGGGDATGSFLQGVSNTYGVLTVVFGVNTIQGSSNEDYGYILFSNAQNKLYYRAFYIKRSTSTITWRGDLKEISFL